MTNINNMYRDLSVEAKARFRQWARDNHKAGQDINCTWHPIIKDECRLMDEHFANVKVAKILKVDFLEHRKEES
jgi:hypothetical protein